MELTRLACALCLCRTLAAVAISAEEVLAAGDECLEAAGCALTALQLRSTRLETVDENTEELSALDFDVEELTAQGRELDMELELDVLDTAPDDAPGMLDQINKKLDGFVRQINEVLPAKLKKVDPLKMRGSKGKVHINELIGLSSMKFKSARATNLKMQGADVVVESTVDAQWGSDLYLCGNVGHAASLTQWGGTGSMEYYDGPPGPMGQTGYDPGYSPEYGGMMPPPSSGMVPNYGAGNNMMPSQSGSMMPSSGEAGTQNSGMVPSSSPSGDLTSSPPQQGAGSCPTGSKTFSVVLKGDSYRNRNVTAFVDMVSMTIKKFEVGAGKFIIERVKPKVHANWITRWYISRKLKKKLPAVKAKIETILAAKLDKSLKVMLNKKCPIRLSGKKKHKKETQSDQQSGESDSSQPGLPAQQTQGASAQPSTQAACSASPGCAKLGLAGDCCPNSAGVKLGCCA